MAPNIPAEIDVFTVPHSRMKELVNKYTLKVQDVDYRNCQEVGTLLKELKLTLHEFKSHESIENMFIMDQLKNRLKQRHIYNSAVCDCHNDNRLQEMMAIVKNGKHLWKTSIGERLTYGHELRKAFIDFVQQFLPHMEEEENIFQPLLIEHFEYDELCVLKEVVLEQHELIKDPLYQEKAELDDMPETDTAIKDFRDLETDFCSLSGLYSTLTDYNKSPDSNIQKTELIDLLPDDIEAFVDGDIAEKDYMIPEKDIPILPAEILIKIFKYLTPPDRGRCAQVCSSWNDLVYSKPLWKTICPIQWARGFWSFEDLNLNYTYQDDMSKRKLPFIKQDEDADIDESEESVDMLSHFENEFLMSLVTYVLPKVGLGVEKIILDGGQGLSSRLIYETLLLCPNVKYISAAYTFFDYYSLKGLYLQGGLKKLKYLDFEGCECVDDDTLAALADCLRPYSCQSYSNYCPFLNMNVPLLNDSRLCPFNSSAAACCVSTNMRCCQLYQRNNTTVDIRLRKFSAGDKDRKISNFDDSEIEELFNDDCLGNSPASDVWGRSSELCAEIHESALEKLNLSGCWRVTNSGLLTLLNSNALKNIHSLNLSSCFNLSGEVLLTIANNCLKLRPENLTYCCNIFNGPYDSEANGCDNIDHPLKVCCMSSYQG